MVAATRQWNLDIQCRMCGVDYIVFVNKDDFKDWYIGGVHAQEAFPYLSANERELLLSETCGECFDKMFAPLDNDE